MLIPSHRKAIIAEIYWGLSVQYIGKKHADSNCQRWLLPCLCKTLNWQNTRRLKAASVRSCQSFLCVIWKASPCHRLVMYRCDHPLLFVWDDGLRVIPELSSKRSHIIDGWPGQCVRGINGVMYQNYQGIHICITWIWKKASSYLYTIHYPAQTHNLDIIALFRVIWM